SSARPMVVPTTSPVAIQAPRIQSMTLAVVSANVTTAFRAPYNAPPSATTALAASTYGFAFITAFSRRVATVSTPDATAAVPYAAASAPVAPAVALIQPAWVAQSMPRIASDNCTIRRATDPLTSYIWLSCPTASSVALLINRIEPRTVDPMPMDSSDS